MRLMLRSLILSVLLTVVAQAAVAASSPVIMLQGMANNMIAGLKANQSRLQSNPSIVYSLVRKNLVPYADVNQMAASAVGPDWRYATASQRSQFKRLFVNLLISTYATALRSYDGDVIRFYPLRGQAANRTVVTVRSLVVRRNGQRIPVSYQLVRRGSTWRIIDFSIENVSMVQSYRQQFASSMQQGGIVRLIDTLKKRQQRR